MPASAFVLMPFAPEFDEIYNLFIADTLQTSGFDVSRADDLVSQQNIIQDVVVAIRDADLIVADLTGANPNVYYEVGLAHAFGRPTILLTQSIEDLPFDLRSYRVVAYDTHFASIKNARSELAALAAGALDGSVKFGSPVADFAGVAITRASRAHDNAGDPQDEQLGFLDHMVALEEGFATLTSILTDVAEETGGIASFVQEATPRINEESEKRLPGFTARVRDIAREIATKMATYTKDVQRASLQYADVLKRLENSLEAFVSVQVPSTSEERKALEDFLTTLASVEDAAVGGRAGFAAWASSVATFPNVERKLNRASKECARALTQYVANVDQTIAMLSRARGIGDRVLRQFPGAREDAVS